MALPAFLQPYQITFLGYPVTDDGCGEKFYHFGRSTSWRQITCSWLDRVGIINSVNEYAGLNVANQFYFHPGVQYPDAPTVLYFDELETEGIPVGGLNTGPNGMVGYELCRMRIGFKTLPYLELDQGVLSIDYSFEDAGLPKNISSFYFNGTTTTPPVISSQLPAITITCVTYTWTRYNLVSIPTSTIAAAAATPIDQSGLFGTSTSNGGTLKLTGVKTNRRVAQNGQELWDMTVQLVENPAGWNCVFQPYIWNNNAGSDTFVEVKDNAGNPPFPLDSSGSIPALVQDIGF